MTAKNTKKLLKQTVSMYQMMESLNSKEGAMVQILTDQPPPPSSYYQPPPPPPYYYQQYPFCQPYYGVPTPSNNNGPGFFPQQIPDYHQPQSN